MSNYTNMVKSNHDRSEAMLNLSLTTISEMVEDGEKVTVAELVRRTGFSRDYFYKNKEVHDALTNAITLQTGKVFINRKEESLLKATRRENELLKLKIISLEKNIATLTAELKKKSSSEFDLVTNLYDREDFKMSELIIVVDV